MRPLQRHSSYTCAATLDTEPVASGYSDGIHTRSSSSHFQYARSTPCSSDVVSHDVPILFEFGVRSVLCGERYRAPHPSLPDAGANPGPATLRQGANFADMVLRGSTHAICGNDTNDGTMPCPPFRLRFPVRLMEPVASQRATSPIQSSKSEDCSRCPPDVSIWSDMVVSRVFKGRNSIRRLLRRIAFAVTNTPQLVLCFE